MRILRFSVLALTFSFPLHAQTHWEDWKPTPNFPGIKIRVSCGEYINGETDWSFQFMNTYQKEVTIKFQVEDHTSDGHPPKYGTPEQFSLRPGEKSGVNTAYVRGTCESHNKLYIGVLSIEDEKPPAQKGATPKGATQKVLSRPKSGASSQSEASGQTATSTAGEAKLPGQNAAQNDGDIIGTSWRCDTTFLNIGENAHTHYVITFNPNKTVTQSEWDHFGDAMSGEWIQNGTSVRWSFHPNSDYWVDMRISDRQMSGRMITTDEQERRGGWDERNPTKVICERQ